MTSSAHKTPPPDRTQTMRFGGSAFTEKSSEMLCVWALGGNEWLVFGKKYLYSGTLELIPISICHALHHLVEPKLHLFF